MSAGSDELRPPLLDAGPIVDAFRRHQVRAVIIGAFAAQLHGAPIERTLDIDFTPQVERSNLDRLSEALRELGARIRTSAVPGGLPFDHDGESLARSSIWNLTCAHGEFDLAFMPGGTDGFDDLVAHAVELPVGDGSFLVASLADVIRSKEAAGREKDLRVLPVLFAYLREMERRGDP